VVAIDKVPAPRKEFHREEIDYLWPLDGKARLKKGDLIDIFPGARAYLEWETEGKKK